MNSHKYSSIPTGEYDEENNKVLELKKSIKVQDSHLDVLSDSVKRLGEMSLNISKEVDLQNRLLSNFEIEVENATDNATNLTKRTQELVKRAGGPKYFCVIVILVLILILLFLMVIYT